MSLKAVFFFQNGLNALVVILESMKVILSRKGFDSKYGGGPSPILPDGSGTMVSLPIPVKNDKFKYSDLNCPGGFKNIGELISELGLHPDHGTCHLDPDIRPLTTRRHRDWLPAFGQCSSALGHLCKSGIGIGDLFLFFGWFKMTELTSYGIRFTRDPFSDWHVIYGYLQVGSIHDVSSGAPIPEWLKYHPHVSAQVSGSNTVFVASPRLSFAPELPGGGTFDYSDKLRLTKPGMSRSRWSLPKSVFRNSKISYHSENSWKPEGYFQSAKIGQEFVVEGSSQVSCWVKSLFER
jgi:hypothetical protein